MNLHWASALRVQCLGEIWPWAGTHITSTKSTEGGTGTEINPFVLDFLFVFINCTSLNPHYRHAGNGGIESCCSHNKSWVQQDYKIWL